VRVNQKCRDVHYKEIELLIGISVCE
jgi:hypothetical protein